jgi:hypothetical protein
MKSDSGESEDLRELEAEVEAEKLKILDLQNDIEECENEMVHEENEDESIDLDLISPLSSRRGSSEDNNNQFA